MTLKELLAHNEKAQEFQNSLPREDLIEFLKGHKKSVFSFHMENGEELIRGDSTANRKEMELFFEQHPQNGVKWIEFHK